jgi:altronate dehydratase
MFSLYSYIQTQNQDIEAVKDQCLRLNEEIVRYTAAQTAREDLRTSTLSELEQRLHGTLESTKQCLEASAKHSEDLDSVSKKVHSLFYKLQCDQMESFKGSSSQPKVSGKGDAVRSSH